MPMYDLTCKQGHEQYNVWLPIGERPPCPTCGEATETLWSKPAGVIPDNVPGGIWVHHGLCHADGSPRRFDSHSEMHRFAKNRGMHNHVEHKGGKGHDKSKHTSRWV